VSDKHKHIAALQIASRQVELKVELELEAFARVVNLLTITRSCSGNSISLSQLFAACLGGHASQQRL
jgi:hypothetical protein